MSKILVYSRWNQWLLIKKEGYSGFNIQVPNNLNFIISAAGTTKMAKKTLKTQKRNTNFIPLQTVRSC